MMTVPEKNMMNSANTPRSTGNHTVLRFVVPGILLLAIVLVGGYFRFVGQNWDDFASLHPDERFLTRNLLPLVGGNLEFTPDQTAYPTQILLISRDVPESTLSNRIDFELNPALRVGVLSDSLAYDTVRRWSGENRLKTYDRIEDMIQEIQSGVIAGIVIEQSAGRLMLSPTPSPGQPSGYADIIRELDIIPSEEIQRLRCVELYPQTNGAGGYFDTECSPLNPHNAGAGFYAYGTLPLFMAHSLGDAVQQLETQNVLTFDFQGGTLTWRFLSAFFDVGTIILIFFTASRMHNRWVGLLAALLYAAAPLAIQKAHYGTVNSVTAFFVMLALWAAVAVQDRGRYWHYAVFGIAVGAAVSGRINTAPLAGVIVLAAIVQSLPAFDNRLPWSERNRIIGHNFVGLILSGGLAFLVFRLCNPYAFHGPGFFGILPDHRWLADLASGQHGVSGASDGPPNWQWMGRPAYIFPLKDMFLWGMGIVMAGIAWFGWAWSGYQLLRGRKLSLRNILIFTWILVYFAWIGRLWVMTMRYYLPLYGALAIFAAWGVYELWRLSRVQNGKLALARILPAAFGTTMALVPLYYAINGDMTTTAIVAGLMAAVLFLIAVFPGLKSRRVLLFGAFVGGFTLLWAVMFTNIYRVQATRVQASQWLWQSIPGDFYIEIEGAPDGKNVINIAVPNTPIADSVISNDSLYRNARIYAERQPYFTDFVAPADGQISRIFVPHLGDADDDDNKETLYLSLSQTVIPEVEEAPESDNEGDEAVIFVPPQPETQLLATGVLTENLSRDEHILGNSYEIVLDFPVDVVAGQRYELKIESLGGNIVGGGSVVLTEGDWDDRLTTITACTLPAEITLSRDLPSGLPGFDDCNGRTSWTTLVHSYDLPMSYPVAAPEKLEAIIEGLHNGDYLAITSNRFYDTEPRNQQRFPLATRYYEALFNGELGYELIEVFDESFELGDLQVSDQHFPIYDSPDWFNEFEADEAFHVYDHPGVFVFKKSDDYDPAAVEFVLRDVPIQQINQISADRGPTGAQIVGTIYWTSLEASQAPTALNLTPDVAEIQQTGGTWSQRFDRDSILNSNQAVGVLVWWLLIVLFGLITFPLMFTLFPAMADRGYGFAKLVGLMLVAVVAWVFSSLKVPLWSQTGLIIVLLMVALFSGAMSWRRRDELRDYLKTHWKQMLSIEMLALILYLFFIGVRLTNPDLWHSSKGGEKPMDFAYFNAVLRSTVFPPYDPWFAGGYINYYYFGFVLTGSPVLLLKIAPSFAYNLIIPTLFSITGIGAFSVAFNIVASWRGNRTVDETGKMGVRRRGNPWAAGIMALLLCVFMGNLDTVRVLGTGLAKLGGYSTPTGMESYLIEQYADANGTPPDATASFEISERARQNHLTDRLSYEINNSVSLVTSLLGGIGQAVDGAPLPIGTDRWYWGPSRVLAETPGVEGNAITEMPYFTFVYGDLHAHMIDFPILLFVMLFLFNELMLAKAETRRPHEIVFTLLLGAIFAGLIQATNTWDYPATMVLLLVGLTYIWWRRFERINRPSLTYFVGYVGGFIVLSLFAVMPYSTWYSAVYGSIEPWTQGKTPLWAYLDIHGLFLFLIISLLLWDTGRWLRSVKVSVLRGAGSWFYGALLLAAIAFLLLIALSIMDYQVVLITVPLILWIVPLFFRPGQHQAMQFTLVLIGFGLALTTGVEFIVIAGDIGRQNTVFKFYLQAWMLFSVAGGVAFAWVFQHTDFWRNWLRWTWYTPLMVLLLIAAMYPVMATRGRSMDRLSFETPLTLDGLEYMKTSSHVLFDYAEAIELAGDYDMIRWLQDNVQGSPVIMEGRSVVSEYRWNSRMAITTGLPSVLGWNFHQRQQRTFDPLTRIVDQREANVKFFYNTEDIGLAVNILRQYDVAYVIVGRMETIMTTPEGLEKFRTMAELDLLEIVYQEGEGTIFEVNQARLDEFAINQQGIQ